MKKATKGATMPKDTNGSNMTKDANGSNRKEPNGVKMVKENGKPSLSQMRGGTAPSSWRLSGRLVTLTIESTTGSLTVPNLSSPMLQRFSLIARRQLHEQLVTNPDDAAPSADPVARIPRLRLRIPLDDRPLPEPDSVRALLGWMYAACRDRALAPFRLPADGTGFDLLAAARTAYAAAVLQVPRPEMNLQGPILQALWRGPPGAGEAEYLWRRSRAGAGEAVEGHGGLLVGFDYRRALTQSVAHYGSRGALGDWDALEEVLLRYEEFGKGVERLLTEGSRS